MTVYRVYDQGIDAYRAVVGFSVEDAAQRYVRDNPPDLMVEEVGNDDDVIGLTETRWLAEVNAGNVRDGFEEWQASTLNEIWHGL